jgi:hypothetical protein
VREDRRAVTTKRQFALKKATSAILLLPYCTKRIRIITVDYAKWDSGTNLPAQAHDINTEYIRKGLERQRRENYVIPNQQFMADPGLGSCICRTYHHK